MHSLETLHKMNATHAGLSAQDAYHKGIRGRVFARQVVSTFLDESASDPAEVRAFFDVFTGYGETILDDTRMSGGTTFSLRSGTQAKTGYAVGCYQLAHWKLTEPLILAHVQGFIVANVVTLAQPSAYVGTWIHEGTTYLDVSRVLYDLPTALALARQHGQQAIYDLGACQEITVERAA